MRDDLIFAFVVLSFLTAIGTVLAVAARVWPRAFFRIFDPTRWGR